MEQRYPFPVHRLPYSYVSLMPHLDADSLYYHHDHYAGAVAQLNRLVAEHGLTDLSLRELLTEKLPLSPALAARVKNLAGEVYNHQLYFGGIYSAVSRLPDSSLTRALTAAYGDLDHFRDLLAQAAESLNGSGWLWLIAEGGAPHIAITHDNGVVSLGSVTPIFVIDLWEHAYFTTHHFDKRAYINAWFDMVNWDRADRLWQENVG